jgi:ribulose-5-phosphate 4-epimerase/fuculose-1-phosphate aldolase
MLVALACLEDPTLPPIDQNAMRFLNRVAIDTGYDGMGVGDEAERLSMGLGNKHVMLMGHHGVLTAGGSVADAFDLMYYFERAAETYITAMQTGLKVKVVTGAVAEKTAELGGIRRLRAASHLRAICDVLDLEDPDYRN